MASGQQLPEQNIRPFIASAEDETDDDFRAMVSRGVLSRTEIANDCAFAKSALDPHPRIRQALRELEDSLRLREVLPVTVQRAPPRALRVVRSAQGETADG